jgi:tripartite-type tricarboxylate transporter receptor subunit TctC
MTRPSQSLLNCLAIATVAFAPIAFGQSGYPDHPIRIVVPSEAGGGSDSVARLIAQGLSDRMRRQVVVENRPGAGTMIGSDFVAKAPADGYTVLLGISPLAINPAMYKKVPFNALRDFAPITQAVSLPNLLVLHPSVPAKTVKEFISFAKTQPGEVLYGSAGRGTLPHLSIELFASMAGIRMTHVPYKSTGPGVIDLVGGRIALMAPNMIAAINQVRAGRLRALGVTTATRVAAAPDIPSIAEAGLPGYESVQWYGLLAPAGTPREIITRLSKETAAVLGSPKSRELLARDGCEAVMSSPEEFSAYLKSETEKWARVVKESGIQQE